MRSALLALLLSSSGCRFVVDGIDAPLPGNGAADVPAVGDSGEVSDGAEVPAVDAAAAVDGAKPAPPDLAIGPDLKRVAGRRIFLLSARRGAMVLFDAACVAEAGLAGHLGNWAAVIDRPGLPPPKSRIQLGQGRDIVRLDGMKVATDETFFTNQHLAPINRLADGKLAPGGACVWTGFTAGGDVYPNCGRCSSWTSQSASDKGCTGDPHRWDEDWAVDGDKPCDRYCHVYCIEQ